MLKNLELHREVKRGNTKRVRELLIAGADVNAVDLHGFTPLWQALRSSAAPLELVRLLLDHGGIVPQNHRIEGEINMLSVCLSGGDPGKLALVLERGADLHYKRRGGYNALIDAALGGYFRNKPWLIEILKALVERGAALNGISDHGESALRLLSRFGRFDAVQLLLQAGADETQLAWTPLHKAVALGTLAEMKRLVEQGENLESLDWWETTPWLTAVKSGDVEKSQYLREIGADCSAMGMGGASPLELAIHCFQTPMLKWLIEIGLSVEGGEDCCISPLMAAVEVENAEAVDVLIAAGADIDRRTKCGSALESVRTREIALRLLAAGADPANLSFQGRRALVGLESEPDESLFEATPEDFRLAAKARWGSSNPERMNHSFWKSMIHSGISAFAGAQIVRANRSDHPVWSAQRFGQSLTLLPDGQVIQIGGEHEDYYDEDFCIYNDVFVHHPDGRIDIFCYPEAVFQPTDFHTATLVGQSIYIIGGLGYMGSRKLGETPIYCLNTRTLVIERIEATGDCPGWIHRHRAVLRTPRQIEISGGKVTVFKKERETQIDNDQIFLLDVATRQWRQNPTR